MKKEILSIFLIETVHKSELKLKQLLAKHNVITINNFKDLTKKFHERGVDLVIVSFEFIKQEPLILLRALNQVVSGKPLIVWSDQKDLELEKSLIAQGAQDYLLASQTNSGNLFKAIDFSMIRHQLERTSSTQCYIINQVASILLESSNISEVGKHTIKIICHTLNWKAGELWLMDAKTHKLQKVVDWTKTGVKRSIFKKSDNLILPFSQWLYKDIIEKSSDQFFAGYANLSIIKSEQLIKKIGNNHTFGFPIFVNGEMLGVILFYAAIIHHEANKLFPMFITISSQLGGYIKRKVVEQHLIYLSKHDSLTNTLNRSQFEIELAKKIAAAKNNNSSFALLYCDVDRFKKVNDALGHLQGDKLLISITERLTHVIRNNDIIGRMGGDEFAIILQDVHEKDACRIARKIIKSFNNRFVLDENKLLIGISIGIAIFPNHAEDPATLIHYADLAMYYAKARGGNQYYYFTITLAVEKEKKLVLENLLRDAIENDQLVLYYQPIVECNSNKIIAIEALMRLKKGKHLILPAEFIQIAENSILISELGLLVLKKIGEDYARWPPEFRENIKIHINVSGRQLNANFMQHIQQFLKKNSIKPDKISLEITENTLIENNAHNINLFEKIKYQGIKIAIDDFGTGYSSFAYLNYLKVGYLKIDSSFINLLPHDEAALMIIKAILGMAQALKLQVIAEGVENKAQLDVLKTIECYSYQGNFFSKALPQDKLIKFLKL